MSQFDFGTIDPNTKSGTQLALDLNSFRDALNSLNKGSSRPIYAQPGMLWIRESSSSQWDLCLFDGDTDYTLRSINPTTNDFIGIPQSQIEGLGATFSDLDSKYVGKNSATGAATLPSGTTAQRPALPVAGMTRYNTTLAEYERYQGGAWVPFNVMDKAFNEASVVTVESGTTVDIANVKANTVNISGTSTITEFTTTVSGVIRRLIFQGVLTITHSSPALSLPGGSDIVTNAGDVLELVSVGNGWKCINYQPNKSGRGRTWKDVTSQRGQGITYTNSGYTVKQILITRGVSSNTNNSSTLIINGVAIHSLNSANTQTFTITADVDPGQTYRLNLTGSAVFLLWAELD